MKRDRKSKESGDITLADKDPNKRTMAQNIAEEPPVCKFNQTEYCRYGGTCPQTHNNVLCSEIVYRNIDCRERHPKTCRYYAQNKFCRLKDRCAYAHHMSKEETEVA